jgi:hypothetical protein
MAEQTEGGFRVRLAGELKMALSASIVFIQPDQELCNTVPNAVAFVPYSFNPVSIFALAKNTN